MLVETLLSHWFNLVSVHDKTGDTLHLSIPSTVLFASSISGNYINVQQVIDSAKPQLPKTTPGYMEFFSSGSPCLAY